MSFDEQFVRKLQSAHTTYTRPDPSMPAPGRVSARMPPLGARKLTFATNTDEPQLAPPSVEVNASIATFPKAQNGTTTLPFGCGSGSPPWPTAPSAEFFAGPHVRPPSLDVLRLTWPVDVESHSA